MKNTEKIRSREVVGKKVIEQGAAVTIIRKEWAWQHRDGRKNKIVIIGNNRNGKSSNSIRQ